MYCGISQLKPKRKKYAIFIFIRISKESRINYKTDGKPKGYVSYTSAKLILKEIFSIEIHRLARCNILCTKISMTDTNYLMIQVFGLISN